MEIVKSNFRDALPGFLKDIEESSFIAFDGEFSGLASERNILPFDTSQEYYEKTLQTSKGFIMIQLGLTFFKKDPKGSEKAILKTYNIYVYPQSRNAVFSCQGQSLSFLATNKFDFNKLFTEGVSYCNEVEEEEKRKEVKDKQVVRMEQLKLRISDEEQDMSNRNFVPVPPSEAELIVSVRAKIQDVLDKKTTEATLEGLNPFQRKLIYDLVDREFFNKVSTSMRTVENKKIMVVGSKRSKEEEMQLEKNRQLEDEIYLTECIGLRLLLKEISASKKLLVGHNCLLDLLYLTNQCFQEPPANYEDFKVLTHKLFPNVIDTKFIAGSEKFKDLFATTVLGSVFNNLRKEPFKPAEFEFEDPYRTYDLENPKEHEAGYDSFLTGYCLLVFLKYLNVPLSDNFEPNKIKELNPFLNRIALQRIQHPFIYITGKEAVFPRNHVFHIKFPSTWQTSDIQEQFRNYGNVQVVWVNSSTAFVQLYQRENASVVLKTIAKPAGFEIQSFAEYQQAEVERKRDLSRKRKKDDSESSDNASQKDPEGWSKVENNKKGGKRGGGKKKKVFADGDQW